MRQRGCVVAVLALAIAMSAWNGSARAYRIELPSSKLSPFVPLCSVALNDTAGDCSGTDYQPEHHIGDVMLDGNHAIFTWENDNQWLCCHGENGDARYRPGYRGVSVVDLVSGRIWTDMELPRNLATTLQPVPVVPPHILQYALDVDGDVFVVIGDASEAITIGWTNDMRRNEEQLPSSTSPPMQLTSMPSLHAAAECQQNFGHLQGASPPSRKLLVASCIAARSTYITFEAKRDALLVPRSEKKCLDSECLLDQYPTFVDRCYPLPRIARFNHGLESLTGNTETTTHAGSTVHDSHSGDPSDQVADWDLWWFMQPITFYISS
jgi:hypothetical protein